MGNEEQKNLDQIGIGKDMPPVEAKRVLIKDYKIEGVSIDGKHIGDKLVLCIEHPDITDRKLEISSVKYEASDKIKIGGIWVKMDKDSKIPYRSALAIMMRFYNCERICDLQGKEIETAQDENGYLVVKGY